jgi:hypothetical protein
MTLSNSEALRALADFDKIRSNKWDKGAYIQLDDCGCIVSQHGIQLNWNILAIEHRDSWEIL